MLVSGARGSEAAITTIGDGQLGDHLVVLDHKGHHDELRDPLATFVFERLATLVDQDRVDLSAVSSVEDAGRIDKTYPVASGQSGARRYEADKAVRNSNGDTGRHERALSGCERSPGPGIQIHPGIARPSVAGQGKLGVEPFDEYLQAVHVSNKNTGVRR